MHYFGQGGTGPAPTSGSTAAKWQGALGPAGAGACDSIGTTRYQLVAKHSLYCVSVFDGSTGGSLLEHAPVKQQECAHGLLNGQYTLEQRVPPTCGCTRSTSRPSASTCRALRPPASAPIIASTCTYSGQSNESFRIEYVNGMSTTPYHPNELSVRVVNRNSGMCLDIAGVSYDEGAVVTQHNCIPEHPNQTFYLRAVPAPVDGLLAKWRMYTPGFYDPHLIDYSNRQTTAKINDVQFETNNQDFGHLILNGTTGYARTGGPVIETQKSFTVSAWVKLDVAGGRYQSAVSQEGPWASAFYLQNTAEGQWRFVLMNNIGSSSPIEVTATAPAPPPPGPGCIWWACMTWLPPPAGSTSMGCRSPRPGCQAG